MKYFKNRGGDIYAYESDGSQDEHILPGLTPLTPEEEYAHLNPPPISADVDTERDRRINLGFEFEGVRYQSRLPSGGQSGDWDIFNGKALEAALAVMSGSQPGDLRWSDPAEDFAWIAANNSRVPMDAQTVILLAKTASAHRSQQTFAGSDLKAMNPIPDNYRDDEWWSPVEESSNE